MANKLIQMTDGTDNVFPKMHIEALSFNATTDAWGNINLINTRYTPNAVPIAINIDTTGLIRYCFGKIETVWHATFFSNASTFNVLSNAQISGILYYLIKD